MEISKKDLDGFFQWLIEDGLGAKKSERLWKKTITARLIEEDPMTLDNYQDFLSDRAQQSTIAHIDAVSYIEPAALIGISIQDSHTKKTIINAIEAGSYIHLFFGDGSDILLSTTQCLDIMEAHRRLTHTPYEFGDLGV